MSSLEVFDLTGKRILITGASSGFGAHFAQVLSSAGAEVILGARRVEKLQDTAQNVIDAGGKAVTAPLDVTNEQSVIDFFNQAGPIDVVVNNAGINTEGSLTSLTEEQWDSVINTNLKGVWLVSREAIKHWVDDGRPGNIVNIASILGQRVAAQLSPYIASKGAVLQLTKSIALDYARNNIRCNAILPGYFKTEINADFMETEPGQRLIKRMPLRRMGNMPELNGPIIMLCSDASAYMSGSTIAVDGGHLCNTL